MRMRMIERRPSVLGRAALESYEAAMEYQRTVFLIGGEDDEQATFELSDVERQCHLRCSYRGKSINSEAPDFFAALCGVREKLADEGLIPFCYGASLNVYPSGMARDMGRGLKAYKFQMGTQATGAGLVDIFASGPDVIPASVELQEQHFKDWIASLRSQ